MKNKYTYCLIFCLCSFCFTNGFTQNIAIGYSSRFILNKSMSFSCEPELKFENIDYFAYQSASVTGAYRYKWAKTISSEFGYRFLHSYKASDDIDIFKNRIHADLSIKIPQNPAGANEANYSSQPDKDRAPRQHLWTVTQQVAAELLPWGRVAQRGHRVAGPILLLF